VRLCKLYKKMVTVFNLKYNVANLGELKFYLATKVSED